MSEFSLASPIDISFQETLQHLQTIWDETGVDSDDRAKRIQQIKANISLILSENIKFEENRRDALKNEVLLGIDSICVISNSLGEISDIDSPLANLPLQKKVERIRTILSDLEKRRNERVHIMKELHNTLHSLWKKLGINPFLIERNASCRNSGEDYGDLMEFTETNLTTIKKRQYEAAIQCARHELEKRAPAVEALVNQIIELWGELVIRIDENNELEQEILAKNTLYTNEVINALQRMREELIREKEERERQVKAFALKISALWDLLHISEDEKRMFFSRNTGLGLPVIHACQQELHRLEQMKQQRMKDLIVEARARIKTFWEELHYGEQERRQFQAAFSEVYTDEALEAHEQEIKRLNSCLAHIRPIVKMIEQREAILKEKVEFEASSSDPNRLLTKKTSRDPGRLLREEKIRKTIEKKLPQLEAKLKQSLIEWEKENQRNFTYYGQRYLDEMELREEIEKQRREEERLRKEREKQLQQMDIRPITPKAARTATPQAMRTPQSACSSTKKLPKPQSASLNSTLCLPGTPNTPKTPGSTKRPLAIYNGVDHQVQMAKKTSNLSGIENSPFRTAQKLNSTTRF